MIDTAAVGAASGAITAAIGVAVFFIARQNARAEQALKIQHAEQTSGNALQTAAEAEEEIKALNERVTTLGAQFALYRELAIEKFVTHAMISELEKRLVESDTKSEQRVVEAIAGLNQRIDRVLEPTARRRGRG